MAEFAGWPEVLWEETSAGSGRAWLSTWGLLLWEPQARRTPRRSVAATPSPGDKRLVPAGTGRISGRTRRERLELQQRLSALLDQNNGDTSPFKRESLLQYDNYTDANAGIGHFRVNDQFVSDLHLGEWEAEAAAVRTA